MPNLVIVAVPEENDYVHKISSQKVAHMTICFLGDVAQVQNLTEIFNFVRHAADTSLSRFGMEVDHRGELGSDNADVLFFSKSKWSGFEEVNLFRSYLLKNDNIRTAYDSTEQHDEWTPHLTLGYPDSPANPDPRDYPGIQYVGFDRIQIWFEEFSGIEIPLKTYRGGEAVAMADIEDVVDDILAHHGVKGMHWGVRRDVHPDIAHIPKKTRKEAAKDAEEHTRAKMFFGEGAGTRRKLINAKVEAKKKKDPLYAQAFDHFVKGTDFAKRSDQARKQRKRIDRTASAKKNAKIIGRVVVPAIGTSLQSSHSQMLNDRGRVTPHYRHSSSLLEEFLEYYGATIEHHGVKGMHWGVRTGGSSPTRGDRKFEKKASSTDTWVKIHNGAAEHFNQHIGALNHKYKKSIDNGDLLNAESKAYNNYHNEAHSLYLAGARKAAEAHGMNPSGTKKLGVRSSERHTFYLTTEDVKHSDLIKLKFVVDDKGQITGVAVDTMAQAALAVADILEHHGVKGMHWGVRKSVSAAEQTVRTRTRQARSPEVTVRDRRKKIKTSGGRGLSAHPDAVRVREIGQRGKGSGLKALSDKDLRDYANRLQLEQNVNRLNYNEKPAAQRFVANLIKTEGSRAAKSASGTAASAAGRSALNAATRKSAKFAAKVAVVAA